MTQWRVQQGDILDVQADGLLCSANPSLNLSGGVGGAFLLRYGSQMQTFLHDSLRHKQLRVAAPGDAILTPACGSPFRAVVHAVAIDVFYGTSHNLIVAAYVSALNALGSAGCRTIAAACLGCGYGHCQPGDFVQAISQLIAIPRSDVDRVTFVTTNPELAEALTEFLGRRDRSRRASDT